MPRPKKPDGYEKTTTTMRTDLKKDIYRHLPYEGAGDLGSFIEVATTRLLAQIKAERGIKPKK